MIRIWLLLIGTVLAMGIAGESDRRSAERIASLSASEISEIFESVYALQKKGVEDGSVYSKNKVSAQAKDRSKFLALSLH